MMSDARSRVMPSDTRIRTCEKRLVEEIPGSPSIYDI
jgi:hypothetical protein